MGSKSSIEWTDATWTPIRVRSADGERVGWGCEKVSDGCKNCYAETLNKRLGTGLPYAVGAVTKAVGEYFLDEKMLTAPLRWRKPRRVFVCSMTDLFGEWVPFEWIDRMFAVMALTPQHTYQVLTKRPERMREYIQRHSALPLAGTFNDLFTFGHRLGMQEIPTAAIEAWRGWPLPNVWLGTSVEDQASADVRLPELLATPAAVRFVSYEPALSAVDFRPYLGYQADSASAGGQRDLIIVGGESGPGARPFDVTWARSTVAQCRAAGVACFVKQLGKVVIDRNDAGFEGDTPTSWPAGTEHNAGASRQGAPVRVFLKDRKGGDMAEWPEDLRVREMPIRGEVSHV